MLQFVSYKSTGNKISADLIRNKGKNEYFTIFHVLNIGTLKVNAWDEI